MNYSVCSREFERDYTWDNLQAPPSVAELAQDVLAPALEGALTKSRFVTLVRCPNQAQGVMLCISVSTPRIDFKHRPICTMAFFRADKDEEKLLASFFSECLRKPDTETLYDAESDVAKAVESLYQTKKPNDFLSFCRSLQVANDSGPKPTGRWAIPRDDTDERCKMAGSLPALIRGGEPFLIALTDRKPSDVRASLGSMFDHAIVRIFSKAVTAKERIPGGGPNTRAIAAAIGGAVILALLVAAGRSCRNDGGSREAVASTNEVSNADGERDVATNAPSSSGISATNALSPVGESGESDGETWRDDSITNAVMVNVEKAAVMTNQTSRLN